ncbi:hypothetical protein [Cytobacillus praedii]|uniref:Uncharacterized protein n=1 Tax=Cytobacillus praedii TaxID=1742358 RepID=A0A4R1ANH8_9BACI|nr:hypothetical protein [Cytobacillus praedii]TCJ01216.1 hypothetical protein E0Y62_25210 [Cytobacillus praedii]
MKIRKRIFGYVIDFFLSIAICIFFSILTFIIAAIVALLFLPFVASDGDTWNPILIVIINGMLLFSALVFMITSLGANFKLTLTWGYKFNGLILENTSKFRLFIWWFIRNGIAGLLIFLFAYHFANDKDDKYLLLTIFIYIFYLLIDGIVFLVTKGKRTFTDIWTGIEVLETTKVVKDNIPRSGSKR